MAQDPVVPTPSGLEEDSSHQSAASESSLRGYVLDVPQATSQDENGSTPESDSVLEQEEYTPWAPDEETDTPGSSPHLVPASGGENPSQESLRGDLARRLSRIVSLRLPNGRDPKEIEDLLALAFERQTEDEALKTKHVGVIFRNLTVKGLGLGAAINETNSDFIMAPLRGLKRLVTWNFGKAPVRTLLHDFTGCVRPGEMLLVLGRPGSGCSTFLKTMANQRDGYEEVLGEVTYGGATSREMAQKFRGEILYNPEEDLHSATLTVSDTLRFALTTRTPGKALRKEGESREDYSSTFLDSVSKLFWIEKTLDTKVGNAVVRGVSGGEKKRVSIAEALVTKASISCWDNSTRGLDANNAAEYVSCLRILTLMTNISSFIALYQAAEALYELFDKVLLIHEGRCLFLGRAKEAKEYFESLGFICPPRWTTADFLTSVTDPNERLVKPGWELRVPRTSEEFEMAYRNSVHFFKTLEDTRAFESELATRDKARAFERRKEQIQNYTISFHRQVAACTARQFKIIWGDPVSLFGRWGGLVFQAFIIGSLFFDTSSDVTGAFTKGGLIFMTLLLNSLMALTELTGVFDSRLVMLKHKSFSFYRPSAYTVAQIITDLPLCLMQILIWGLVVYFMSDLGSAAGKFFVFLLVTFLLTLTMQSFFRMIGAFTGNMDSATRFTGLALQAVIVYTGYLIPPTEMHPWFSWLKWINPVQYAFEAAMANEFDDLHMECLPPFLVPFGNGVQPGHQSCSLRGSQLNSVTVAGRDYIMSSFGYSRKHLWRNVGILVAFWLFFAVMTAVGQEYQKPNKGGASVTVFERGQAPKHVNRALLNPPAKPVFDAEMGEKQLTCFSEPTEEMHEIKVTKSNAVFTFENITYSVPSRHGMKTILNGISGYVRPGRFTALMGESGAGKTTLLNTLAQRLTIGTVSGTFLVDGKPLPLAFQRATAFAQQDDVHESTATVREALRFSALLRQPREVPLAEKYAYVEYIINLLEMTDIAGAVIGTPGAGLNQEQRKRLTIGVELASKPELLIFLDEPTSGFDSGAAFNIVRFLRKLADAGQAVLCTIHQPSAVLFENFDDLILLKAGGQVVYHGPLGKDASTMTQYFERHGAKKCEKVANPAEYMLTVIGAGDPNHEEDKDWGAIWLASPEHKQRLQEIAGYIETGKGVGRVESDSQEYAMPWSSQMMAVLERTWVSYWRAPGYIAGIFALHIITALFNGFSFYNLGNTVIAMQSRVFALFLTLTIAPPLMQQLQARFLPMRDVYTAREASSKVYHWTALTISMIIVEIPYRLVAGTLYFVAWYYPVGFPRDSGTVTYAWGLFMIFQLYYTGLAQALSAMAPNPQLAALLVPAFFIFVCSFCGVLVMYADMPYFWRSWMYWLSPFTYMLEGMQGVLAHNVPVICAPQEFARLTPPLGIDCQTYTAPFLQAVGAGYVQTGNDGNCEICQYSTGDEFNRAFHIFYSNRWRDLGVSFGFVVFNTAWVLLASWIYFGGVHRLVSKIRKAGRKEE